MTEQSNTNAGSAPAPAPAPADIVASRPPAQPTGDQRTGRGINWAYQCQQYGVAIAVAAVFFTAISVYVFYRRGYYNLYIANKALAGDAAILIGFAILLGPLSRMFDLYDRYVQYRKEFGIVAFFLAVAHAVISYFFLEEHFKRAAYVTPGKIWPFIFGVAATILITAIFVISNEYMRRKIGPKLWWRLQYWGARVLFVLVALHVGVMKWRGWLKWYREGGSQELVHPEWPGASLLVGWFMLFVILVRMAEYSGKKVGIAVWYASVILLPAIYVITFIVGGQFAK